MNLSEIFIRRPIMTILVMISLLFFGILAYKKLPVSDLPNVDYPTIQVSVNYPGAKPEVMANNVVSPLEKQFMTIDGITSITSTSNSSEATIVLQFVLDKPLIEAAQDVQTAINEASPQLPQDLPYAPTYTKVNPSASPILYLAITSSTMTLGDVYDYALNFIGQRINMIEGVAQVQVFGSPYAVRIQVDPQKLAAKGIGFNEMAQMIKNQNVSLPTGTLYGTIDEYTLDVNGQINVAEGYESLIIKNENGSIVRVSDVGRALDSLSDDKYYLHFISQDHDIPCVILPIQTQPGVNALGIIQKINALLPSLEKELPAAVQIHRVFDKSDYINESIHEVQIALLFAFCLVVLVIFFYLGKARNTLIPCLALPLSIVGTLALLFVLGYSIDILSLLAIILSIGFLVDDAIVVLENIVRRREHGEGPIYAALEGSKQISLTILSMTLCLITVFIPLLFMGGVVGKLFTEFGVTIVIAVALSGFISLSLTPMLCSKLIPSYTDHHQKTKIELFSERLNTSLLNLYKPCLEWAVTHRLFILLGGIACLILTVFLFFVLPRDFLPAEDIGFIQGFTQASDNTSPFQMIAYQKQVTEIIKKSPYVDQIVSLGASPNDNQGIVFIRLKPIAKRPPIEKVIRELYQELYSVVGVQSFLKIYPLINLEVGTSPLKGDYQYTLRSLKEEELFHYADILAHRMKSLPGFSQISSDLHNKQTYLKIDILRDRASDLNIDAQTIEQALKLGYSDSNLSPINEPQNQYYVITEVLPKFYQQPSNLSQIYLKSSIDQLVPLTEVIAMREAPGLVSFNHFNGLPSVTIAFNLHKIPLSTALQELDKLSKEVLPPSVTGRVEGTASIFKDAFSNLNFLLLITLFVIYVILGILYENFFHPLTVMSTLPPAALGGLLTLLIIQEPLSLYPFVGLMMLLGIVLKNGIILVDFANEAVVKEGKTIHEAITHACQVRFRPILMTTFAAMMGAVPIALGIGGLTAGPRRPLGLVIIGGLIFSQILTLFFTPVIYIYLEIWREKLFKTEVKAEGL